MKMKKDKEKILSLLSEEEKKILFWDYYPEKLGKIEILQRIAEFFPNHGRKPLIIKELYKELDNLRVDTQTRKIIEVYYEVLLEIEKEFEEKRDV